MKPFERIIDYQHRHSFMLHNSNLLSLFNFILTQTNRKIMHLPNVKSLSSNVSNARITLLREPK